MVETDAFLRFAKVGASIIDAAVPLAMEGLITRGLRLPRDTGVPCQTFASSTCRWKLKYIFDLRLPLIQLKEMVSAVCGDDDNDEK